MRSLFFIGLNSACGKEHQPKTIAVAVLLLHLACNTFIHKL